MIFNIKINLQFELKIIWLNKMLKYRIKNIYGHKQKILNNHVQLAIVFIHTVFSGHVILTSLVTLHVTRTGGLLLKT